MFDKCIFDHMRYFFVELLGCATGIYGNIACMKIIYICMAILIQTVHTYEYIYPVNGNTQLKYIKLL